MTSSAILDVAKKLALMDSSNFATSVHDIELVEKSLKVSFSNDFKKACLIICYHSCISFPFISFPKGVIIEALAMREHGLPNDTLVLFEEYESIMLMKCLGTHEEIYWIAIEDFERFCNGEKLEYDYNFFPTFTAFFEYLLDKEEKERAGKNCD